MSPARLVSGLACVAVLLASGSAAAFCRTTTCDPNDPEAACEIDDDFCVVSGIPLAWASSCVTVGVHDLGSPRNGLSYDDVETVVKQAFDAWNDVSCPGGKLSIQASVIGAVECGVSEYNSKVGNANIVLFREEDWPYAGAANAIGLTTTRFDTKTGELWDADIELNGVGATLTVGDPIQGDDLLSVLTHEAGHFLGLSHSLDGAATMKSIYDPARDGDSFRSLAPDDVAGICAIYPPDREAATDSCDNRHGFSGQCRADQREPDESSGCSLNTRGGGLGGAPRSSAALMGLVAMLTGLRLARRRRIV
ncbi:MAG: matrixin family metalloprotease [Myxococcales bacterium]|nr:MAG: matrixin family metalloprotease [Myxococcales bacterium]